MKASKLLPSRRTKNRCSFSPQKGRRYVLGLLPSPGLHSVPCGYPDDSVTDPSKCDPTTRGTGREAATLANLDLSRSRFHVYQLDCVEETHAGRLDCHCGTSALTRR